MATTPFGAFVRRERQDRNLLLGDAAKMLKISIPYLSQIETGQRFVADGLEDKVIKAFELSEQEAAELRRAAALSRSEYRIPMTKETPAEDRSLAHDLAESFARLTPEAKEELRNVLKGRRNG